MRWVAVLLVAAVGLALGTAGLLLLGDDAPAELLPDLDQAAPSRVEIVQDGDTYQLAFASAVDNVGAGPLLLEGDRSSPGAPAMAVRQLVRRTDGTARSRTVPMEIRYVGSEMHEHWHLVGFEGYELRRASGGPLVRPKEKTGLCLGDRYETDRGDRAPEKPNRPVWTDECGRDQPGLLTIREGISPGYGDDYDPEPASQFLDVTGIPAGRYLLVHRVNPERALEESDYGNNAASVLIQLRRSGELPSVRVLATCPAAETCSQD